MKIVKKALIIIVIFIIAILACEVLSVDGSVRSGIFYVAGIVGFCVLQDKDIK